MKTLFLLPILFLLCGCSVVDRNRPYPDVTVSRILRVIDGDTFACDIDEHSAIAGKNISIRIRGIDTPELKSKAPEERKAAMFEQQRLSGLLRRTRVIELRNIDRDKYFRIDADVYLDGEPLLPKLNQRYCK